MPIRGWKKNWRLMSSFFTKDEINTINEVLKKIEIEQVIYCSLENRFAKSGGLAMVTVNILPYLNEINKIPAVYLVTPLYPKLIDRSKLRSSEVGFTVPYDGRSIEVNLYEYTFTYGKPRKGRLTEYYLEAQGFFEADGDPYVYDKVDPERNEAALREASLFFCKAVPLAMKALGITEDILFHLQEWQTALLSFTSKEAILNGTLKSCATIQTMHNPYDSYFSKELLAKIIVAPRKISIGDGLTAYQAGLGLVDGPITTVSENFAKEFTSDILQREHFAPHLQDVFKYNGVFGINNGMFVDFSPEFPKKSRHIISDVKKIKLRNRKALLKILDEYKPEECFGELFYKSEPITRLPDDVPIFVMSGRLDPNQKGYDIFLRAMEKFNNDEIKVIMTPMPIRKSDLDYFYEVACKCKGNLTVFPKRMKKGFTELQMGSTFGVMPSIYEPFGAAVEYMAHGTVNVARATGGLVDQINKKCGLSYREPGTDYTKRNIEDFFASSDIAQIRKQNPWAISMSEALYRVLREAVDLYKKRPDDYYQLILNGFMMAGKFGWNTSAKDYYDLYKEVKKTLSITSFALSHARA